ncbi:hypothetical protein A6V37_38445 [Paraburkholderia ginsengiterrae]|uniref:Uncharacterized protein n=1 Tax=Paraburkholderia ginsengiterrae TaxID=1462993 RepID=A0A1A9N6F2_9BURK|nr:hypothetical protein A6V37_38445 [Paraburkholderia ginsengiterrae]
MMMGAAGGGRGGVVMEKGRGGVGGLGVRGVGRMRNEERSVGEEEIGGGGWRETGGEANGCGEGGGRRTLQDGDGAERRGGAASGERRE